MARVTKDDLRHALRAWEIAREKVLLAHDDNISFLRKQQGLILSLIDNDTTTFTARRDVDAASADQLLTFHAAWQEMDDCCREYDELLAAFRLQQAQAAP